MDQLSIIEELNELIQRGKREVLPTRKQLDWNADTVNREKYNSWRTKCLTLLLLFLDNNSETIATIRGMSHHSFSNAAAIVDILGDTIDCIEKGIISVNTNESSNYEEILRNLFSRFHAVARQLRSRHDGRETIEIEDEYDVQDLVHALLKLFFTDIRAEEWTPSYAGKTSRMDFLLKREKCVIEIKKTRTGLSDKEIGSQLIEDIDRYKTHPDCNKLVCFVYDPEGKIGNPEGIMSDLNERHNGFVEVIIEP